MTQPQVEALSGAEPEVDAATGRLSRWPLHVVLLAMWPALTLWSSNANEVRAREALPFVWAPVLVATLAVIVLRQVYRRKVARLAIIVALMTGVTLLGGRAAGGLSRVTTVVVLLVVAGLVVLGVRLLSDTATGRLTEALNVIGIVLVALTLVAIVPSLGGEGQGAATTIAANGGSGADIWYLIPDRYPRADTLEETFDYNNEPFLSGLEERGFDVATQSLANYPKTAHSLASTWNLEYLDDLIDLDAQDGSSWGPLYALLREHTLGKTLQESGYEYSHLGTWWSPTALSDSADRNIRLDARSEFAGVFLNGTLLGAFAEVDDNPGATGTEIREGFRDLNFNYTSYQLDQLDILAAESRDQPRFVMAHITQPHEPYVFDRDGSRVSDEDAKARTREDNLVRQVENINTRMTRFIDTILARDPDAVIVIQSDEGPHPRERTGPSFDWTAASTAALDEKLRTISAIRLPGGPDLPDDRTGVNTWRWILNTVIGTDLEILPNHEYVYPGEDHLYDLVEVTDRVS